MIVPRRCPAGVCSCKIDCCFMSHAMDQLLHGGVYLAETLLIILVKNEVQGSGPILGVPSPT